VSGDPRALTEAWQAQAEWSARASALKVRIARRRSIVLWLVAGTAVFGGLGTVLTTAAAQATTTARLVSAIAAVLAAVAGTIQLLASRENTVEQWNRARAVAEALKEAVYRYHRYRHLREGRPRRGPPPAGGRRRGARTGPPGDDGPGCGSDAGATAGA